jgi:outer membrane protein assembly factor BamB
VITLSLLLSVSATATAASWTLETPDKIKWYVPLAPVVVVASDKELLGVEKDTGEIQWRTPMKKMDRDRFHTIEGTTLAILSLKKKMRGDKQPDPVTVAIDTRTGQDIWSTKELGFGDTYGVVYIPDILGVFLYGKRFVDPKKKTALMVNVFTGEPYWESIEPFKKWDPKVFGRRAQPPVLDTDSTMVLFLNSKAVRRYNLLTGELIWESEELERAKGNFLDQIDDANKKKESGPVPEFLPRDGYSSMVASPEQDDLYVPHHNTLAAISLEDGSKFWEKEYRLGSDAIASQLATVPEGVIVRSWTASDSDEDHVLLLDRETGEERWKAPRKEGSIVNKMFTLWLETTNFEIEEDRVLLCAHRDVIEIDLATGQDQKLNELDFEAADEPVWIEPTNTGFLVVGSQNAAWIDDRGVSRNGVYVRPPDNVGWGLGLLGIAFAANRIGKKSVGNVEIQMRGDYSAGFEQIMREYSATADAPRFLYMLSGGDGGPYIVRLSKVDGKEMGRVKVAGKKPKYSINPYDGSLILKRDEKKIERLTFE